MPDFTYASKLVADRVELAMTSTIQIMRGDLGVMDPNTLLVSGITNVTTIYTGKAHIHNVNGAGMITVGDAPIDTRTVAISIPISAPVPRQNDLVKVTVDSDPDLPNRIFRVMDVNVGGLLNSCHVMTCQGWFEGRAWF